MTSFTGESSFTDLATNDPNNPGARPSNYMLKHRLTLRAGYAKDFWGDNTTRFTLMGYYDSGQIGSYTMFSEDAMEVGESNRHLLYVPDGLSDPNVIYTQQFIDSGDQAAFFDWIAQNKLKPGFVQRNSVGISDSMRFDLRMDQEIPLFVDDLKARAFVKIYNFTNFLNDDWGRQYDVRRGLQNIISLDEDDPLVVGDGPLVNGAYAYDTFSDRSPDDLQEFPSMWEIRLGLEVNFN